MLVSPTTNLTTGTRALGRGRTSRMPACSSSCPICSTTSPLPACTTKRLSCSTDSLALLPAPLLTHPQLALALFSWTLLVLKCSQTWCCLIGFSNMSLITCVTPKIVKEMHKHQAMHKLLMKASCQKSNCSKAHCSAQHNPGGLHTHHISNLLN